MRILPEPLTESPERRPSTPAAGLILGTAWIAALGVLVVRHLHQAKLRQGQKTEATGRPVCAIAREAINHLSAIRGYCEMSKITAETRYLDAAIETADEMAALLRKLCKALPPAGPE